VVPGQASVALPVHVTDEGLRIAAQLTVSSPGDDGLLLGLAGQVEQVVGWQHRHPVQWNA
jgi:Asp-tRNA(Asn)/Glu-tRNA(Gln) amidotransferase A subunit family amidase